MNLQQQIKQAKELSYKMATSSLNIRNKALKAIGQELNINKPQIIQENQKDLMQAQKMGISGPLYERLILDEKKINHLIQGINDLENLNDPLDNIDLKRELDDDLILTRKKVPIGVIGVIFESRPDALIQIASLALKSGNVCCLKGGKEAAHTNKYLYNLLINALSKVDNIFNNCLILVETREDISKLLQMDSLIDLMIPRGSNQLVKYIKDNTKIPVLGHADGICHLYIDENADLDKSLKITIDSKCQYPAACNALETLLIHKKMAHQFLPKLKTKIENVKLLGDLETRKIIDIHQASELDWMTEYGGLTLSIKIVNSVDEAISHINQYGSNHTDSIVTENKQVAQIFMAEVNSSSVFHNCSTRFSDGFVFGFGAEVGISTSKIHARGPVGMEGLTTYKYYLEGKEHTLDPYSKKIKQFKHKDLL